MKLDTSKELTFCLTALETSTCNITSVCKTSINGEGLSIENDRWVTEGIYTWRNWALEATHWPLREIESCIFYMANSLSGQDQWNPALRLSTRAGKMALSCPLGITRCIPQENSVLFHLINPFIDQAYSVKMAGYWPRSFFCLRVHGPRLPALTAHLSNIRHFFH